MTDEINAEVINMEFTPLSRIKSREQAFIIAFEMQFQEATVDEIISLSSSADKFQISEFAYELAGGVEKHSKEINDIIEKFSQSWKMNRISKVSLSLLQIAVYELLYVDSNSPAATINAVVDLAKKYATQEDAAFINGVLGGVSRSDLLSEDKKS
ncbi:MAG: transcription antitermination factor NusB [Bacillota bacterium]|nr:transcription antitermination factor NusB [Bacillota bacterium]